MGSRLKKATLGVFFVLTVGFVVNLHFLQKADEHGVIGRRQAADLGPAKIQTVRTTGSLGRADAAAQPDKSSSQGVIVLNAGIRSQTTKAIQRELRSRGYDAGDEDGVPSLVTRAAIMAYEHDHRLVVTGTPSKSLLDQIQMGTRRKPTSPDGVEGDDFNAIAQQRAQVVRTVQQSLKAVGYMPGLVDGRMGEATARAIREFEIDQDLPETGRISGRLISRLARLAGNGQLASR
ncbi:MAG: peptidoglycan-binding domain-containing protein [Hyphomicrobiaceae bacterium]